MLVGFLKFIFILVAIYYVTKFLSRYVLPFVLKKYINKKMGNNQQYTRRTKEGKININNNTQQKKHFDKDEGEYVDYEEIKDD